MRLHFSSRRIQQGWRAFSQGGCTTAHLAQTFHAVGLTTASAPAAPEPEPEWQEQPGETHG
jgi:hypothetical protein